MGTKSHRVGCITHLVPRRRGCGDGKYEYIWTTGAIAICCCQLEFKNCYLWG